jgi:hypothetical protein
MSSSFFSQSSIFRCTRLKYGSEGCGCSIGGIVGFLGPTLGCVEGVAQPSNSAVNSSGTATVSSLALCGKASGRIRSILSSALQTAGLFVRSTDGRLPFQSNIVLPLAVHSEVGKGQDRGQGGEHQHAGVEQEAHANWPPARS